MKEVSDEEYTESIKVRVENWERFKRKKGKQKATESETNEEPVE